MRPLGRRIAVATLAATALACTVSAAAAIPVAPGIQLVPGQTEPNREPDGNSILLEAPAGFIVFDTGRHLEHTRAIIDAASAAGRPVQAIINSHWHLDHTGGNRLLRTIYPQVRIYASSALQEALGGFLADERRQMLSMLEDTASSPEQLELARTEVSLIDSGAKLLPTDIVSDSGRRMIAGRVLELHLEARTVTAGDVWVYDPATHVLLAGDLVTLPAPFLDTACPSRWQEALGHLAAQPFQILVPGHGPPMSRPYLTIYRTAFTHLLSCAAAGQPKESCAEDWVSDSAELVPQAQQGYARALIAYYVQSVLRGDPARIATLCGGAAHSY